MKHLLRSYIKGFLLFSIIAFNASHIFAQKFEGGFLGGLSTSQIDGDTQKDYSKLGFYSGFFVETMFTKVIGVKAELYYIGKGAKKNVGGVAVFKTHLNYVELPFLLKIVPIDRVELDVGLAFSYLVSTRMFEYGEEVPSSIIDMHNTDFSAVASGSYYFSPNMAFNVRIDYSIVPISNNPNWFNSNLSFGIFYKFK